MSKKYFGSSVWSPCFFSWRGDPTGGWFGIEYHCTNVEQSHDARWVGAFIHFKKTRGLMVQKEVSLLVRFSQHRAYGTLRVPDPPTEALGEKTTTVIFVFLVSPEFARCRGTIGFLDPTSVLVPPRRWKSSNILYLGCVVWWSIQTDKQKLFGLKGSLYRLWEVW